MCGRLLWARVTGIGRLPELLLVAHCPLSDFLRNRLLAVTIVPEQPISHRQTPLTWAAGMVALCQSMLQMDNIRTSVLRQEANWRLLCQWHLLYSGRRSPRT